MRTQRKAAIGKAKSHRGKVVYERYRFSVGDFSAVSRRGQVGRRGYAAYCFYRRGFLD